MTERFHRGIIVYDSILFGWIICVSPDRGVSARIPDFAMYISPWKYEELGATGNAYTADGERSDL